MAKLTASEMHYEARIIYESIVSNDAPGVTEREWSELLTIAQSDIIMQVLEEGLDKNEENRRIISELYKSSAVTGGSITATSNYSDVYDVVMPTDYLHVMSKHGRLTLSTQDILKIVPNSHDFYKSNLNNPYKQPYVDDAAKEGELWELVAGDDATPTTGLLLIAVPTGRVLDRVIFNYVKQASPIIVPFAYSTGTLDGLVLSANQAGLDCKLDPYVHRKIIKKAADLAAAYTRDKEGYQLQKIENRD